MKTWRATAELTITWQPDEDETGAYVESETLEFTVNGVDLHAAGIEADDVVQAELGVYGGKAQLESLDIEEL